MKKTVVVGMSGGVDSSVSALLLKQQGFHVIGLFMKNWEDEVDEQGVCSNARDFADVASVCSSLDIPYYAINFVQEYRDNVFNHFLNDLRLGHTPNPDILCNREIKFKAFLNKAMELGADFLATGHYCQNLAFDDGYRLYKGKDSGKDQSYFLYTIGQEALQRVLFPIGHLTKHEVRLLAKNHGLATSEKKDSTGICFIGERNFKQFVSGYIGFTPGDFETLQGKKIGRHEGIAYYTIGQRKGLNIGGPGDAWFVVGKDPNRNVVWIEQGAEHPALYRDTLQAAELSWVSGREPPSIPYRCSAKIRYRQTDQLCTITEIDSRTNTAFVIFDHPQRAITLRQSIVFYDPDGNCLGGGMINAAGPSYYDRGLTPDIAQCTKFQ